MFFRTQAVVHESIILRTVGKSSHIIIRNIRKQKFEYNQRFENYTFIYSVWSSIFQKSYQNKGLLDSKIAAFVYGLFTP